MKFRDYAANETSLLISRLLAKRSKKSSADLQAFSEALEHTAHAFEETLASWAKIDQDQEVADLIERLTAAAAAQAQAMAQRTKADSQAEMDAARKERQAPRRGAGRQTARTRERRACETRQGARRGALAVACG